MIRRMRRTTRYRLATLAATLTLGAAGAGAIALAGPEPGAEPSLPHVAAAGAEDEPRPTDAPAESPPVDPRTTFTLDPESFELDGDHYVQRLEDGRIVHLTLVPDLQKKIGRMIDRRKPPHASLAAIEPSTGRVLSLVSRSHAAKRIENYALRAEAPSASVFKLVTGAALLELAQIDPEKPICYAGGASHLTEEQIRGTTVADADCGNLGDAIGRSLNVVIARLAYDHLSRSELEEMALRFGFNREIPFELPVDVSEATFSEDDVERARTAAGFWNVNLSALHGALIAAAIANEGVMMRPTIVDRVTSADGKVLWEPEPEPWLTVMSPQRARTLQALAESTTVDGTARKAFQAEKDWPEGLRVAGKTGTLSNKRPYLLFTWFVGSAPLENPNIAVGSVVANPRKWWIKGMHTSAAAIKSYQKLVEVSGDD